MKILKEYLMISLGVLMVATGIYFFKFPNNFSTGGVSGISVILSKIFPMISKSLFVLIINMALLALGFLVLGRARLPLKRYTGAFFYRCFFIFLKNSCLFRSR